MTEQTKQHFSQLGKAFGAMLNQNNLSAAQSLWKMRTDELANLSDEDRAEATALFTAATMNEQAK